MSFYAGQGREGMWGGWRVIGCRRRSGGRWMLAHLIGLIQGTRRLQKRVLTMRVWDDRRICNDYTDFRNSR